MLRSFVLLAVLSTAFAVPAKRQSSSGSPDLVSDISVISNYWGQLRPYENNDPSYFGVENVGLPNGCQVEKVNVLHRHGSRYPTGSTEDGTNDKAFSAKWVNYTANGGSATGELSFLNGWSYQLGSGLLVETGAAQEFTSGANHWNRYGRLLFDAQPGQNYYNSSFVNGTARPAPVWRTTSQPRIYQSAVDFASGFFGFNASKSVYNLVVIPEGGTENNTLASYDSCPNDNIDSVGYIGDADVYTIIPQYLGAATQRLSTYVPNFNLTTNDTYAMQSLCAYEYSALGSSDFCGLFTLDEWNGFEYTLDVEYAYDYAYQNPTGRAQGVGYVQELLARLQGELVQVGNTSVNATLDGSADTFGTFAQSPFILDMSHDDILLSTIVALSYGFLNVSLPLDSVPTNINRSFVLSHLTPFASRFTTEVIGCSEENPAAKSTSETYYTINTNGYSSSNATYKFVRQRLNDGILPINTIQGANCTRTDGLCSLDSFIASQADAEAKANYQFVCFADPAEVLAGFNNDGASFPTSSSGSSAGASGSSGIASASASA